MPLQDFSNLQAVDDRYAKLVDNEEESRQPSWKSNLNFVEFIDKEQF